LNLPFILHRLFLHVVRAILVCSVLFPACALAANEAGLLALWNQQAAAPNDHKAAIKACESFISANPEDPLVPVVREIESWHLFCDGCAPEAVSRLVPYLTAPAGPVTDGAQMVALGWLTRIDREKVVAALHEYYLKEIEYPKSLNQFTTNPKFPADDRPPMADRFGNAWVYQLTGFVHTRGFTNQKYSLQSTTLGALSDLKAMLKVPYGSSIKATPVGILASDGGAIVAVKFKVGESGAITAVGPGQTASGLHVAFVGSQIVAVCDYTHWKIFQKP